MVFKKKKNLLLVLSTFLLLVSVVGCGRQEEPEITEDDSISTIKVQIEEEVPAQVKEEETVNSASMDLKKENKNSEETTKEDSIVSEIASSETTNGGYQKGSVDGNVWENPWIGLTFTAPENFVMIPQENLDGVKETLYSYMKDTGFRSDIEAESFLKNTSYEMFCTSEEYATNVQVLVEKLPSKMKTSTYVEVCKRRLPEGCEITNCEDVTLFDVPFSCIEFLLDTDYGTLYEYDMVNVVDDTAFLIEIGWTDNGKDGKQAMIDCFSGIER